MMIILCRALPMVSSLLGPQYHDDQFWTFSEAAPEHQTNDFDVPMVPTFADDFEVEKVSPRCYLTLAYS